MTAPATMQDQAAGLREWAQAQPRSHEPVAPARQAHALMVTGLPDTSPEHVRRVERVLEEWRAAGQRWLGASGSWRVVPIEADSPHLAVLTAQQARWALWIDNDPDAFRRAYLTLKQLRAGQGPRCLLALPARRVTRSGLLNNLQQAAEEFLGLRLLVLDVGEAGMRVRP